MKRFLRNLRKGIFPYVHKTFILHNRAECTACGHKIESKHVHDYVECKCGLTFLDGGRDYIRYNSDHTKLLTVQEKRWVKNWRYFTKF